jgi:pyruvate/2-oxoglutarate dehydrogenase complex dihydrolipoamide acyltransferase (E2) component
VADDRPTPFKKGTRVVTTSDLPGVPEGTVGTIGVGAGLVIPRYWVRFENGVEMGSIIHKRLVREKDWPAFQAARDQAAAAAAEQAARAAERAKAARAKAAEEVAADGEAQSDAEAEEKPSSPADDRLAALMARSKAARAAKAE